MFEWRFHHTREMFDRRRKSALLSNVLPPLRTSHKGHLASEFELALLNERLCLPARP